MKSVSVREFARALEELEEDTLSTGQAVYRAHSARLRRKYEGFAALLDIKPTDGLDVLTAEKVDGYMFSASLFVSVAENRTTDDLRNAFLAIDSDRFFDAFTQIVRGNPQELVRYHTASRKRFPGFCEGISLAFESLDRGDERQQEMAVAHAIFAAVLLKLAEAEEAAPRKKTRKR